ncbi:retrovirus-related pol polyprotein from transposon TNT 1-94 [Tanacetum coccineum]
MIGKYLHVSLCSGTETKEGLWKELQFSLKVYKAGKGLLYVKRNKAISLGKGASKVGIEVQQLSIKECTWEKGANPSGFVTDEDEVSSDDNEMVEVKVLLALAEENDALSKEGARNGEWVKISMRKLSEAEGFILANHDTGRILPPESQRNTTDPPVAITNSSATDYDSADESLVCSTHLPPLKKLDGAEPVSRPKTIKLILKSKSTLKAKTLKGVKINEPSSAHAKGNKSSSALKVNSAPAGKLKSVKIKDDPPLAIAMKELNDLKLHISKNQSCYSIKRSIQNVFNMPSKDVKLVCDIKKPIGYLDNGCSRHMTGVKSNLHKYIEQPGPKVVFGDDSTCVTEGVPSKNSILVNFYDEKGIFQNFSSPYTPEQNGVAKRKNRTLIEAARIMISGSVFSKQYWTEAVATTCYTQNRSTIVKRHLKTPYEIFCKRIPNINFLHVFGCLVYIHNHKDHLGKFDGKDDDGYLLRYSLVSKAFRVFNTRRQQTKETYHITFDESPDAIKFLKSSVDNINIAENERYPPDKYLHP